MTHAFADENMLVSRVQNFLTQCGVSDLDQPLLGSFMHIYWPEGAEKKTAINNALYSNFINMKIDTDNAFFDDFDRSEDVGLVFFYTIEKEDEKTFFRLYAGYIDLELTPKYEEAFETKSIMFNTDHLSKRSHKRVGGFFENLSEDAKEEVSRNTLNGIAKDTPSEELPENI